VSPDKRTLFLHAEQNLLEALKVALEERFAPSRSTFNVNGTQTPALTLTQGTLPFTQDLPQLQDAVTSFPASSQITDARPTAAPDVVSTARRLRTRTFEVSDEEATRPSTPQFPSSSTPTTDQEPDPDFPLSSARLLASASFSSSISVRTDYSDFPRTPATPPISSSAPRGPNSTVLCRTFGRSSVLGSQSPLPPTFELRARRDTADTPSKVRPAPPGPLFLESDEEDNQGAEQPKESSPEVIMSTQGASWAREPSLSPDSEERAAAKHLRHASITSENLDDEDVVPAKRPPSPKTERAAKRAKMGVQPAASRGVLRSRLASFAAPGSQVVTRASSSEAEEILGAEEENEDSLEPSEEPQLPTQPSSSKRHREQSTMRELFRATLEDAPMANYDPDDVQMSDTPVIPAVFDILRTREPTGATPVLDGDAILSLDIDRVRSRWQRLDASADTTLPDTSSTQAQAASLTSAAADADAALSRLITKDDFAQMEILGQFNLGFIVTRLGQDLWIVDQHAADEKYNFEDLQKHTRIQSQRLVQPRALELSAADELVAREHVDVLRQNGFEVDVGENSVEDDMEEGGDEPRRRGLHLVAQPISKNTVFDTHGAQLMRSLRSSHPDCLAS
jgi:DNA mismatch repair protein PMS2